MDIAGITAPPKGVSTLESYQAVIFQLYIVQKQTLNEVMAILKQDYNFEVS